jgi:hypothetical protein
VRSLAPVLTSQLGISHFTAPSLSLYVLVTAWEDFSLGTCVLWHMLRLHVRDEAAGCQALLSVRKSKRLSIPEACLQITLPSRTTHHPHSLL